MPAAPVNYFPYAFLAYLAVGLIRVFALKIKAPERMKAIHEQVRLQLCPGSQRKSDLTGGTMQPAGRNSQISHSIGCKFPDMSI